MRFSNVLKVRLVTSVISNAGTHVMARGFPVSVPVEFVEVLPVMAVMARSLWLHAGTTNWP